MTETLTDDTRKTSSDSRTILLVEDDGSIRSLIVRFLAVDGYQVLAADGAEKARTIATKHSGRIDLLITDVVMPGGNGLELAEQIATLRPETKVLFLSGHSPEEIFPGGRVDANSQFLAKPFSDADLACRVRDLLGKPTT